ncbi:MarR family transcriptional regulator, transcriptional regulator for hemolysin [Cytobacillus horneckiae]|uniref:MarR family transcriptional regulator n=1 Tax=Cytobacillus horneckiae TaxID=549687 RepID=A0A2N0ZMM6_9BACI|nr:MarR family transcriptional regulator [Cytobacillus horneckiae]MBN6886304.1 MarR family transcriptional regulator [Cytobacillus horneckiae]MEC1159125.1 MarR family transcriptional regulator [Cytobacillus horneckiae]MED2938817.1 MarR family transcriptional regulator [Cytobacillus horneckiae]PKG30769.1 MarR family transcriptional regulator [Cytobacillus horneckiae]
MMLYRPFENKLNAMLSKHQLQRAQWTVFYYLNTFGPATLVEIANYQGVEKPTVTRTINRLEELGFVEKIPSSDKREKRMQLTQAGIDIYLKIRVTIDEFEMDILNGVSAEEQQDTIRIMQLIRGNLINQGEEHDTVKS